MNKSDKLNIVLADDEMHVRMIIKAYLSVYNVKLTDARNGKEALELIRKNPDTDLLIVDYSMPIMNGREVIGWLRGQPDFSHIPVIVYTAGGFSPGEEAEIKSSAEGYIEKSNIGEDLIPTIKDILGSRFKKVED
jgi:CheY-like chemotaxis protein